MDGWLTPKNGRTQVAVEDILQNELDAAPKLLYLYPTRAQTKICTYMLMYFFEIFCVQKTKGGDVLVGDHIAIPYKV